MITIRFFLLFLLTHNNGVPISVEYIGQTFLYLKEEKLLDIINKMADEYFYFKKSNIYKINISYTKCII